MMVVVAMQQISMLATVASYVRKVGRGWREMRGRGGEGEMAMANRCQTDTSA